MIEARIDKNEKKMSIYHQDSQISTHFDDYWEMLAVL